MKAPIKGAFWAGAKKIILWNRNNPSSMLPLNRKRLTEENESLSSVSLFNDKWSE